MVSLFRMKRWTDRYRQVVEKINNEYLHMIMVFLYTIAMTWHDMTWKILVKVFISVGVDLLPGFKLNQEKRIVISYASDSFKRVISPFGFSRLQTTSPEKQY